LIKEMAENQISLAQYFEQNNQRLDRIERATLAQKTVLTFDEFCRYTGISKSWGYKLTSARAVPHYKPNDKAIYFQKEEVDKWLLQNPIKTTSQLKLEAKGGRTK
jgi:excisionase family DNA binding protein